MQQTYAVFVRFQALDVSFVISSARLPDVRTWLPYAATPDVTAAVAPISYGADPQTLPPGFGVDAVAGEVSGVTGAPGEYVLSYTAQDAFRSRTARIPLTVIDSPLLLMTDGTPLLDASGTLPVLLSY